MFHREEEHGEVLEQTDNSLTNLLRRRSTAAYVVGVIEYGRTRNYLTLCTVPALVLVRVWVHTLGDLQSVQLRNATTTVLSPYGLHLYLYMDGCGCTLWVTLRVFS